ncbi:MAG TPA: CapA family protein [Candidatus Paceibacterota bacterium]
MSLVGLFLASIVSLFNFTQLAATSAAFFDAVVGEQKAVVLFGGDMMFDRSVRTAAERNGEDFLFSCIDTVLAGADLTVANLEGPITDNLSRSVGSAIGSPDNFIFTFPRTTAELLKRHRIEMVSLGNNHILNFGYSGVRSTQEALQAAGVAYFGDPIADTVTIKTVGGISFALIAYNEFGPYGGKAAATTTERHITEAKIAGFMPVVFAHWGIEYEPFAAEYQRLYAHRFVDAGAVAVIGAHPHVVQNHEIYNGVPIYYSLGNFVFDQYFIEEVRHGLFLKVTFNGEGVESIEEIPIVLNKDRTVCPVTKSDN